jgi:hypothetical protein
VNEQAGAKTPLSLIFASITLAFCLLFLTGFLQNLPKAVLAAFVLMAVKGLIKFREIGHLWRVSRLKERRIGLVASTGLRQWMTSSSTFRRRARNMIDSVLPGFKSPFSFEPLPERAPG